MTDISLEALPMRVYRPGGAIEDAEYMPTFNDYTRMGEAIAEGEQAGEQGDNPIGSVLVLPSGDSIATQTREFRDQDLDGHAEALGYRLARHVIGRSLNNSTAYCLTEPCFSCAYRYDKGELGMLFVAVAKADAPDFFRNPDTLDTIWSTTRRTLRVVTGLRKIEAFEVLTRYGKKH